MWSYNIYKIFGIRYSVDEEGAKREWDYTKRWLFFVYIFLWSKCILIRFVDEFAMWSTERYVFQEDGFCCCLIQLYVQNTHDD